MICPNISSPEWKALEEKVGRKRAYEIWSSNGFEVPPMTSIQQEIGGTNMFPKILSAIRASKENTINATTELKLSAEESLALKEVLGAKELSRMELIDELQGRVAHTVVSSPGGKATKIGTQYVVSDGNIERMFATKQEADKHAMGSNTHNVMLGSQKIGSFDWNGNEVSNIHGGRRVALAAAYRVLGSNPSAQIVRDGVKIPMEKPLLMDSVVSGDAKMQGVMDILSKSGIPVVSMERWKELSGQDASAQALADTAMKIIAVREGRMDANSLSEETAHMAIAALPQEAVMEMLPMVEETVEWQQNKEAYLAAYEGDVMKAKIEVLGKLLADHILKQIPVQNAMPMTLLRRLREAWNRFMGMFRGDNLSDRLSQIAKEVTTKGINKQNIKNQGIYFLLETSDFKKNFADILRSIEIRIEALRHRNKSLSVTDQVERLEQELKELKDSALTGAYSDGFVRFLTYLAEDIKVAMDFVRRAENQLVPVEPEQLMQLKDFIDYYEPYVKNIKQFLLYGDITRFPQADLAAMERLADDVIEAFNRIKYFRNANREQQFLRIIRNWWAEELQLNPGDPDLDGAIARATGGYDVQEAAVRLSSDGNIMQWWFGSLKNASDPLLNLVYAKVMRADQRVHLKTLNFAKDLTNKLNELGIENQDKLIERDQGKRTGYYVEEYKVRAHKNAKSKFFESLWVKYRLSDNADTRALEMEQWEVNAARDPNGNEAIELAAYKMDIANWFARNTIRKTTSEIRQIIADRKAMFSPEQFEEWQKLNMPKVQLPNGNVFIQYKGELVMPSDGRTVTFNKATIKTENWKSDQYAALSANEKEFLSFIQQQKMIAQKMLPGLYETARMPQLTDKMVQILKFKRDNVGKRLRDNVVDEITERDHEDLQIFGNSVLRPDGTKAKYVPIYFTRLLGNPALSYEERLNETDKISTDLVNGLVSYYEMAARFNEMSALASTFELIAEQAGQREFHRKNGEIVAGSATAIQKQLRTFLDMQVYGMHIVGGESLPGTLENMLLFSEDSKVAQAVGLAGKKISLRKLFSWLSKYVRANNLGLNFFTTASNFIQSWTYNRIEDMVRQYTSVSSAAFAEKTFWKNIPHVISETGKLVKTNKMYLLMESMGLVGDTKELFQNTDFSRLSRRAIETGLYFSYEMIDFYRNARVMMSVTHNYRIAHDGLLYSEKEYKRTYPNGNYDNLATVYDMITISRDGKINWPGVTQQERKEFLEKFMRLASRVKHVSQAIDGKLDRLDYAAAHQHFIGNLLTIHRGWLIQGLERRFKAKGINVATGDMEEGYWMTTYSYLKNTIWHPNKVNFIRSAIENWHNLSPMERENVSRMMWEFAYAGMTMIFAIIMNGLADDEDEYAYDVAAYMANRALLEVGAFVPPIMISEISNTLANPVVPMRHVELMFDLPDMLFGSDVIERGQWKDFTKRERAFARLIPGIKGLALLRDPKSANQFLKNKPLRTVPFELYKKFE